MQWMIIILCAILFIVLIIPFLKVYIHIAFLHTEDNDEIKITAKLLFGLISYTYRVPLVQVDNESASIVIKKEQGIGKSTKNNSVAAETVKITPNKVIEYIKQAKLFLEYVVDFYKIIKKFMGHITIHKLEWKTSVGLGDAAQTGTVVGIIWSLKGGLIGIFSRYVKLKKTPEIFVTPVFEKTFSHSRLQCIFSFRIGYATHAAFSVLKYWKSTKGGRQYARTSDSRIDDNSYGKLKAND